MDLAAVPRCHRSPHPLLAERTCLGENVAPGGHVAEGGLVAVPSEHGSHSPAHNMWLTWELAHELFQRPRSFTWSTWLAPYGQAVSRHVVSTRSVLNYCPSPGDTTVLSPRLKGAHMPVGGRRDKGMWIQRGRLDTVRGHFSQLSRELELKGEDRAMENAPVLKQNEEYAKPLKCKPRWRVRSTRRSWWGARQRAGWREAGRARSLASTGAGSPEHASQASGAQGAQL